MANAQTGSRSRLRLGLQALLVTAADPTRPTTVFVYSTVAIPIATSSR